MSDKILFVDDDTNILSAFKRQFRKAYEVHTAATPMKGLEVVRSSGPFSVVVSDMRMPEMDGVRFLAKVKSAAPDTVRIILTGHADMESAIAAVNQGQVFSFLTKPCPPDTLDQALKNAIRQYRLVRSEKELLQGTLKGTINVLTEILSLVNPEAFGRASRLKRMVRQLAEHMGYSGAWRFELAAMLSQIGCVILPQDVLNRLYHGQELNAEERQLYEMHPSVAQNLLKHIPRLDEVISIIAYQEKYFDGSGIPKDGLKGEDIPLGARILRVALDFDLLEAKGMGSSGIFKRLKNGQGTLYDPLVLEALEKSLGEDSGYQVTMLGIQSLREGMIFAQEVFAENGLLLVSNGQEVNNALILRLKTFAQNYGIREPIKMYIPVQGHSAPGEARKG